MPPAAVRILHLEPDEDTGELTRLLARARSIVAEDLAERWVRLGAPDVEVRAESFDNRSFGERVRSLAAELPQGAGIVVLGSGSIPLATDADLAALLAVAGSGAGLALTNNRSSSDVVAVGNATVLASVPDLAADNALPRWLESQGVTVDELPGRWRLGLDLDSPLDLELLRRHPACPGALAGLATSMAHRLDRASEALDELAALAANPRAELLVSGRISATMLRRLESATACRIRAFVEERGLRASADIGDGRPAQRPPASALGLLLDRDGPAEVGMLVNRLADGALLDTRVLFAHRNGPDERAWPSGEDRFASDLLLADRVRDPWLQQLTLHAWSHKVPIALGAHSLVGPGLPLALGLPLPGAGDAEEAPAWT